MKIALIDDDSTTNFINKVKLKKAIPTCEINVFSNGKEALNYLENGGEIDVALLDLNMPIMNGMQFLKAHNNLISNKIGKIILFIEQKIDDDFKNENGLFLSVQKPLDEDKINLIFNSEKILDLNLVKDLEEEILIKGLQIFKKNSFQEIKIIEELYTNNNLIKVQKLAHKLGGSAISVGLKSFADIAFKIENNIKKNKPVNDLISELKENYKEVLNFLKKKYEI